MHEIEFDVVAPVARSPITCQVSWIVNAWLGASTKWTSGIPLGSIRGLPASSTTQPPISQSACRQPLANGQRPLTQKPPCSAVARPLGANTPATMALGLA